MVEMTTSEALDVLRVARESASSSELQNALDFAIEKIEQAPERCKYKFTCTQAGDASFELTKIVYADNKSQAWSIAESAIYAEYKNIRRVENCRLLTMKR